MHRGSSAISAELVELLQREFVLDWNGIHGAGHWARVRWNGLLLARETGASRRVVELFAFLHDSRREHDGRDSGHGHRAAQLVREINGKVIDVDASEVRLLEIACRDHSSGEMEGDVTVQTCWDADRLDLGRIGVRPDPDLLCTVAARRPETIRLAYERSLSAW